MPVHHAITLREFDAHQRGAARTACARARVRPVRGAMRAANQPLARIVEESVRLPIEFHGHVRAAIQVRVDASPVTDGERAAGLPCVHHVERNGHAAFDNGRKTKAGEDAKDKKIQQLEAKLTRKNEVMAELMEAHTELKKSLGEI